MEKTTEDHWREPCEQILTQQFILLFHDTTLEDGLCSEAGGKAHCILLRSYMDIRVHIHHTNL